MGDFAAAIGIARLPITPPLTFPQRLWAAAPTDFATGVHGEVAVTALAIAGGTGDAVMIVTADLCEWRNAEDETSVRVAVATACGLDPDRVFLHSTHTHASAAPDTSSPEHPDEHHAYLALIAKQAAAAAVKALKTAVPAVLSWGAGASRLAGVRDQNVDGRSIVGWDPSAHADDTLMVGRITDGSGRVTAVIVNYACHPTTLGWRNTLISPDFIGALRDRVEERHAGALCLFLQGASGDLAPVPQYSADPADADRAGRSLALSVEGCLELMAPPGEELRWGSVIESGAPLGLWVRTPAALRTDIRLQREVLHLRRKPPHLPDIEAPPGDERVAAERRSRARAVAQLAGDHPEIDHEISVCEIGDAVLVTHPGEAYSWLQQELRRALAPRPVIVANLTNGAGAFYLPTPDAYDSGAYAALQTPVAAESLQLLRDAVLALVGSPTTEASLDLTPHLPGATHE